MHQPLQAAHAGSLLPGKLERPDRGLTSQSSYAPSLRANAEPLATQAPEVATTTELCSGSAPRNGDRDTQFRHTVRIADRGHHTRVPRSQAFFTEQLGMPLSMEPNFEDYSCEMVFGRVPPPTEEDPAYKQVGSEVLVTERRKTLLATSPFSCL